MLIKIYVLFLVITFLGTTIIAIYRGRDTLFNDPISEPWEFCGEGITAFVIGMLWPAVLLLFLLVKAVKLFKQYYEREVKNDSITKN